MAENDESTIRAKFEALSPFMDERVRRLWAGTEAEALGLVGWDQELGLRAAREPIRITNPRDRHERCVVIQTDHEMEPT